MPVRSGTVLRALRGAASTPHLPRDALGQSRECTPVCQCQWQCARAVDTRWTQDCLLSVGPSVVCVDRAQRADSRRTRARPERPGCLQNSCGQRGDVRRAPSSTRTSHERATHRPSNTVTSAHARRTHHTARCLARGARRKRGAYRQGESGVPSSRELRARRRRGHPACGWSSTRLARLRSSSSWSASRRSLRLRLAEATAPRDGRGRRPDDGRTVA